MFEGTVCAFNGAIFMTDAEVVTGGLNLIMLAQAFISDRQCFLFGAVVIGATTEFGKNRTLSHFPFFDVNLTYTLS